MARELVNVNIKRISIVTGSMKPVNGKAAIIKGQDKLLKADKVDSIKGLLYVTVMAADEVDKQNDMFGRDAIQKAAHAMLKAAMVDQIDENHDRITKGDVVIVESYIDSDSGDWKAVIDISENQELMQKATAGEIHGVSIDGLADVKKGMFERVVETLKSYFENKEENKIETKIKKGSKMNEEEIKKAIADGIAAGVKQIADSQEALQKAEAAKVEKEALQKSITDLTTKVEELEKAAVTSDADTDGANQEIKKADEVDSGTPNF